jgi:hypothetical protein
MVWYFQRLLEEHIQHFPWFTHNMAHYYIITYTDDNIVPLGIFTGTNNQTSLSGLTDASPIAIVNTSGKASAQIPQLPLGDDSSPWGR